MENNFSVWDHYLPGFVHPDFVPYLKYDSPNGLTTYNTWKRQGNPQGLYNAGTVRKGWGQSFQLLHPDDPCPIGTIKDLSSGFCFPEKPEYEPVFYSEKAFVPKRQFWGAYGLPPSERRESSTFDLRSINPFTGSYVIYYLPKSENDNLKYNILPTKNSYLGQN